MANSLPGRISPSKVFCRWARDRLQREYYILLNPLYFFFIGLEVSVCMYMHVSLRVCMYACVYDSLQHISPVYRPTVVCLACLQSLFGTAKHTRIQMKPGKNFF